MPEKANEACTPRNRFRTEGFRAPAPPLYAAKLGLLVSPAAPEAVAVTMATAAPSLASCHSLKDGSWKLLFAAFQPTASEAAPLLLLVTCPAALSLVELAALPLLVLLSLLDVR